MNPRLASILQPAYTPCEAFQHACSKMRWHPPTGHIPRGFIGATGRLEDVELVLVFAEPGEPQPDESHSGLESALAAAHYFHGLRRDRFHSNVRDILDACWPELAFEDQLKRVWMTESVLCSAPLEGGHVAKGVELACGQRYLLAQLALFPDALVVALGQKAQRRLRALGFHRFMEAFAVAPPGCNRAEARESWKKIPAELRRLRSLNSREPGKTKFAGPWNAASGRE